MIDAKQNPFGTPRTIDACLPASHGGGVFFEMEAH